MSGIQPSPSGIPPSPSDQTLVWLNFHISALQEQIDNEERAATTPYAPREDAKERIDRIGLGTLTAPKDAGSAKPPVRRDLLGEFESVKENAKNPGFRDDDLDAALQALEKLKMDEKGRRIEELLQG